MGLEEVSSSSGATGVGAAGAGAEATSVVSLGPDGSIVSLWLSVSFMTEPWGTSLLMCSGETWMVSVVESLTNS